MMMKLVSLPFLPSDSPKLNKSSLFASAHSWPSSRSSSSNGISTYARHGSTTTHPSARPPTCLLKEPAKLLRYQNYQLKQSNPSLPRPSHSASFPFTGTKNKKNSYPLGLYTENRNSKLSNLTAMASLAHKKESILKKSMGNAKLKSH